MKQGWVWFVEQVAMWLALAGVAVSGYAAYTLLGFECGPNGLACGPGHQTFGVLLAIIGASLLTLAATAWLMATPGRQR